MKKAHKLTPAEELAYLKKIHGEDYSKLFGVMTEAFTVLQSRAQLLLSLIVITLTITGFSGPVIAESSTFARLSITGGLTLVLISVVILIVGPLQLRWGTHYRTGSIDESLEALIHRRNVRTTKYYAAGLFLIVGFSFYCSSMVAYLLSL